MNEPFCAKQEGFFFGPRLSFIGKITASVAGGAQNVFILAEQLIYILAEPEWPIRRISLYNVIGLHEFRCSFRRFRENKHTFACRRTTGRMTTDNRTYCGRQPVACRLTTARVAKDNRSYVNGQPVVCRRTTGRKKPDNRSWNYKPKPTSFSIACGA